MSAPQASKIRARMDGFLEDLEKISRQHKIAIGGCGCCGSPSLMSIHDQLGETYTYTYESDPKNYSLTHVENVNWGKKK